MTGVAAVAAFTVRAAETEIFVDPFDLSGATCGFGRQVTAHLAWHGWQTDNDGFQSMISITGIKKTTMTIK